MWIKLNIDPTIGVGLKPVGLVAKFGNLYSLTNEKVIVFQEAEKSENPCKLVGVSRKQSIDYEFFADVVVRGSKLYYRTKKGIHDWFNLQTF